MLEIQTPVYRFLFGPKTINFFQKNLIISRDLVSLICPLKLPSEAFSLQPIRLILDKMLSKMLYNDIWYDSSLYVPERPFMHLTVYC